ncbi:3'-kinase [Deinococcus sp. KSM4-11]|nr:3'-kinase [Deinococcus sp. KSM4-11]
MTAWQLELDGDVIRTFSSEVYAVRWGEQPAMLKIARHDEELRGHTLMTWLGGHGAARVYRHQGAALLMERLNGSPSLPQMVADGKDDDATRILVGAAHAVHQDRPGTWPALPDLRAWFRSLEAAAAGGGDYATAWEVAQSLLETSRDVRPLHGDVHHGNVMTSPAGDWRVIDPKGLIGETGYDYANMLCNPSLEVALHPGRLERQVDVVVRAGGSERSRLLAWVQAYSALSAAWSLESGDPVHAARTLELSRRAAGLLASAGN